MAIDVLRRIYRRLGAAGIAAIVLAPLITAAIAAVGLPRLAKTDVQSRAVVSLYPVIGTHAAYDVSSYVADFIVAVGSPEAAEKSAAASTVGSAPAGGFLTATRLGDNAGAEVTFTGGTAQGAEAGLRAAIKQALFAIADADRQRAAIKSAAARTSLDALAVSLNKGQVVSPALAGPELAKVRDNLLTQAANRVEATHAELQTTAATVASVSDVAAATRVTTKSLTNSATQLRVFVIAEVASIAFAVLLVLFLTRGRARPRRPRARDNALDGIAAPPDSPPAGEQTST